MARQAKNNSVNKFKGLKDSPAIQGIEKIYEANEEARQKRAAEAIEKQQDEQAAAESAPQPQAAAPSAPSTSPASAVTPAVLTAPVPEPTARKTGKKTQNGITIYVPMEYYMQILQMKMETGTPIKDIALQAVIEYLDRHKNG